jgi:hypothetical protein
VDSLLDIHFFWQQPQPSWRPHLAKENNTCSWLNTVGFLIIPHLATIQGPTAIHFQDAFGYV